MPHTRPILVIIRTSEGKFLAGEAPQWSFVDEPSHARVFDYLQDDIASQLDALRKARGMSWAAVPVDPKDRYETCDRCGSRVVCRDAFFDGSSYVCRICRQRHV